MKNEDKTKEQLINELVELRQRVKDPETCLKERKQAEEALWKSEERYRLLAENVRDVIWTTDMNLRFTYFSPSVKYLRGYSAEEAMTHSLEEILTPTSFEVAKKVFAEELELEEQSDPSRSRTLELEITRKDGSTVWSEIKMTFLRDSDGRPIGILGVARDITERKQAEERIKASLREKEILLREIHHRVKNNLQIISALLDLQSQQVKDKEAFEIFTESRNRIKSMALIHEQLYQFKDLAKINMAEYIQKLATDLFYSSGVGRGGIELKINAHDVLLGVTTAIPCGLIINELVSNALKI